MKNKLLVNQSLVRLMAPQDTRVHVKTHLKPRSPPQAGAVWPVHTVDLRFLIDLHGF